MESKDYFKLKDDEELDYVNDIREGEELIGRLAYKPLGGHSGLETPELLYLMKCGIRAIRVIYVPEDRNVDEYVYDRMDKDRIVIFYKWDKFNEWLMLLSYLHVPTQGDESWLVIREMSQLLRSYNSKVDNFNQYIQQNTIYKDNFHTAKEYVMLRHLFNVFVELRNMIERECIFIVQAPDVDEFDYLINIILSNTSLEWISFLADTKDYYNNHKLDFLPIEHPDDAFNMEYSVEDHDSSYVNAFYFNSLPNTRFGIVWDLNLLLIISGYVMVFDYFGDYAIPIFQKKEKYIPLLDGNSAAIHSSLPIIKFHNINISFAYESGVKFDFITFYIKRKISNVERCSC